ncbi:MAG: hypothetical protein WA421_00355, partial [Nitrososphaeraceae archaeon]
MSALLKDRVWVMLSGVAKRGIYPLHASRLGVFRIPIEVTEHSDISSITNDLKSSAFKIDTYADRIYLTYKWTENGVDQLTHKELFADLNVTVEVVTGEVIDIIYQIKPLEFFGDHYWVRNYRQKADQNAKMVIDTVIRNSKIGDKLLAHYQKAEKLSLELAIKKLEELTPLAKNPKPRSATVPPPSTGPTAAPPPPPKPIAPSSSPSAATSALTPTTIAAADGASSGSSGSGDNTTISLTGTGTDYSKVDGPIDQNFKSKRQVT